MTKYEYECMHFEGDRMAVSVWASHLGGKGWRMVGFSAGQYGVEVMMEREISSEDENEDR